MTKFKLTKLSLTLALIAFSSIGVSASAQTWPPDGSEPMAALPLGNVPVNNKNVDISIGYHSYSGAGEGVAIGNRASIATGYMGVAIGADSSSSVSNAIALGSSSNADRAAGAFGVDSAGQALTESVSFSDVGDKSGAVWTSTKGVVSVGSSKDSRQITGVAAGSQDNDAVNVAQLKSLKTYTDTQIGTITGTTVFGSQTSTVITPTTESDPGKVAQNAVIVGNSGTVKADNGGAFGYNAQVALDANGAVAIGANSMAANRIIETIDGEGTVTRTMPTGYLMPTSGEFNQSVWQGDVNHGVVSFGGTYQPVDEQGQPVGEPVNFNRQLTGVAAGSEDNDAVNVAQLKQLENNTATQLNSLMTGETKVSTVQLTAVNEDGTPVEGGPTIGLRYQVASESAQADGDSGAPTVSQGRLVYNNMDATGAVYGTETIATLSDGIKLSGGSTFAAGGAAVDSVDVSLNQGISFLGDEYLQTTVTEGENGGAVVTVGASQALKDFLANSGVQPSEPTNPSNPGNSGNSGGTWTPNAAQQAALNGNFANGITVAAGEGNQAIQIKQGNVDMGGNRIQNVGNPINDGDAANKAYVDSTSRSLRNKINDVDKDLRAGVAMAMAVGNLPQAYMPGKSILAVSAGTYHGQGGFALGLSHATDNRQWVFKGAASVDTRGNFGGTLSAGYQF